ncbi:hypothetical protein ABT256_17455 [Amycolatopsis japonica]|uniref:hypothetical protein n=1 Tax=Amycolatopsis japonica TaxID=208439 RepID=UPI00333323C8
MAELLKQLTTIGAHEQVAVLARRAATESPLGESSTVRPLLEQLRDAEADEQIAALIGRLPAAGEFDVFSLDMGRPQMITRPSLSPRIRGGAIDDSAQVERSCVSSARSGDRGSW